MLPDKVPNLTGALMSVLKLEIPIQTALLDSLLELDQAILDALPIVEHVNPMQNPEGVFEIPPLSVRWKSKQLGDLRDSTVPAEAAGVFRIGLYDVDVVAKGAHEAEAHFTLRRVGWVRR